MPALYDLPVQIDNTVTCVSAVPILKKMKVLQKFKKRMGITNKPASEMCNVQPLLFHHVCGDNVRIDTNGKIARRIESFCKGISFSNRPVKLGERVCVKLLKISNSWSGVIRFGFSSHDPATFRDALPKYVCPDLTSKPGFWAKALSERYSVQGLVVHYYYNSTGDVHFGINGEEKGVFFSGVDAKSPLWVVIDVYGNSTAIEFMDPLAQLNNRIVNDLRPLENTIPHSRSLPLPPQTHNSDSPPRCSGSPRIVNRRNSSSPTLNGHRRPTSEIDSLVSPLSCLVVTPVTSFHRVKGRNAVLNDDRVVASRVQGEYSHGYVFSSKPLTLNDRIIIKVLEIDPLFLGALAFGLTAANPAGLDANDLPDDCDLLLDRPEYWVVSKDVASSPSVGDELAFCLTNYGTVTYSKNNSPPQTIMHVDHTLQLWAFFDVYGNTKKIQSIGKSEYLMPPTVSSSVSRQSGTVPSSQRSHAPSHPVSQVNHLASSPQRLQIQTTTRAKNGPSPHQPGGIPHECTVCLEKSVNSVLYMCGHMCMCYECAMQQWRGRGGGLCPICRAPIRDVIRTYRS